MSVNNCWMRIGALAGFAAFGLCSGIASPVAAEMVAHWSLDDGQVDPNSLTAVDAISPAANTTWQGVTTPRWMEGILGGAAAFGGSAASSDRDDVLAVVPEIAASKLDITGAMTISAWILHNEFGSPNSTRHIAGKDQSGGLSGDAFSLKHNMSSSANTLQFMVASGGANINLSTFLTLPSFTAASPHSGWVHVAGVFDPGNFMGLYVNGFLEDSRTGVDVPLAIDSMPSTNFTIGRLYNPSGNTNSFNGSIDDVQVYGQALNDTQIQTLFGNPGQADTGLVGRWLLDDGQNDPNSVTAIDSVSPGEHGTWQNVTPPRWTTGLVGGAAEFGGASSPSAEAAKRDDVISVLPVVSESKLDLAGALSIAAWIKREEYGSSLSTRHIAGKDQTGGPEGDAYSLKHQMSSTSATDTLQFLIAENGMNTNLVSLDTLTNYSADSQRDGWIHVAGVFQPGEYMRLYIDGVLDNEQTTAVPTGIDMFTSTPFTIGRLHGSTTHSFNGGIDDVRLYDHALSLEEILALVAMVPISGSNGDHNGDGFVNAADYVFWRDTMGDEERYNAWRSNFGAGPLGSGANGSVPEPTTSALCAVIALAMLVYHRRSRERFTSH